MPVLQDLRQIGVHERMACRGGRIHTQWGCREVLYEETSQGAEATGLRMTKAGKEQIVEADVYVAALDVPGAPCLPICLVSTCEFAASARAILAQCASAWHRQGSGRW